MTVFLYGLTYASVLTFIGACVVRILRYARAPLHLRWELYPVPHEEPKRVEHGGSYFETLDWWTKPTHFNLLGELRFMAVEMLFLVLFIRMPEFKQLIGKVIPRRST